MVLGTDREDLPGTAEFVLPANQQNWSPLGIHNFDIFDRGGVLFELASSYSVQKARPLYGSGPGSPQGIIDQLT